MRTIATPFGLVAGGIIGFFGGFLLFLQFDRLGYIAAAFALVTASIGSIAGALIMDRIVSNEERRTAGRPDDTNDK